MIKVLVAEDHPIVRDLLRRLLEQSGDIEIVAMERNGEKAVNQAILHRPNVAVIDISMPIMEGVEATKEILTQSPETRVLMISGYSTRRYIQKSLEAGALDYILKDYMREDLIPGVRALSEGSSYFSQQIDEVAKRFMAGGQSSE